MDLYEAIEVVGEKVDLAEQHEMCLVFMTDEEIQAVKICLEAARDKAGV